MRDLIEKVRNTNPASFRPVDDEDEIVSMFTKWEREKRFKV